MKANLSDTISPGIIPVLGSTGSVSSIGANAAPVASGCVRWCMNVALQSFGGEPWAVQMRPFNDGGSDMVMSVPGKHQSHHQGGGGNNSATSFHGKTTTQAAALENNRANAAGTTGFNEAAASSLGAGSSVTSSTTMPSASASSTSLSGHEGLRSGTSLGSQRRRSGDGQEGLAMAGGATVTFGEGFGSTPTGDGSLCGAEHVTAAERCGRHLCTIDYDDLHEGSDGSEGGAANPPFPMPSEELEALRECVQAVNDPPVTYGNDELLGRIANVEFLPSGPPTPEGLNQYSLHSSLEPILHATLQPAVTAVVDHCVSSMVLVYGATQEMKQMGLIGTPEECGLLPHGIRMFMDRYTERREQQSTTAMSSGSGTGSATGSHPHIQGAEDVINRVGTPSGSGLGGAAGSIGGPGSTFVFPSIGSSVHRFTRIEASFIAFDAVNVVDLLDLSNKHIELVLRLAPPPTPSEFEDTGADTGAGRPHRPTTDSFVLNARVTPAETTNDALSALDVGLENLARALEAAMFQSESGSSLLFSLTAYTDSCRCATFHVLCLAEDPAAQTWLASTILARSQAIPLGEEQSWASIQNTPMPPPLHHHAATILVPALCFGNMFTSVLICVYNSMTALGRLNRDLTLAVTGYRMRTIPRVTSATARRSTKKLPPGWEEHFTEDGRRYFTDTSTQLSTWSDPRLTPGYQSQSHRGSIASSGGAGGKNAAAAGNASGAAAGAAGGASASAGGGSGGIGSSGAGATGEGGGGGAGAGRQEGSNAYTANGAPQQLRRSRIALDTAQGDRDFLTRALQQPTESSSGASNTGSPVTGARGASGELGARSASGLGEDGIPVVDVGIVVIDTECRPRVVLNSQNPDFMTQFELEQKTLTSEKERRQQAAVALAKLVAEQQQQQQRSNAASVPPSTTATAVEGDKKDATNVTSSLEDSPASATQPTLQQRNGNTSNTTNSSATGVSVTPPSPGTLPRSRTEDDLRGATTVTALPTAHVATGNTGVGADAGMATASTSSSPQAAASPAVATAGATPDRPALDPRRLALNPDLDDDDEDDDMFALSRTDATSIDDFVFDDDSDEDFASAVYTPADDAVITSRRFYQNAMQEQVAMPLEEARGTSVVGTPVGSQSPLAVGGGGAGSPTSANSASPASVAISPEMQDLESLVEEFSKFFAQAYESEEELKALRREVKRLHRQTHKLKAMVVEQPRPQPTPKQPQQPRPQPGQSPSAPARPATSTSGATGAGPSSGPRLSMSANAASDASATDLLLSSSEPSHNRHQRRLCGRDPTGSANSASLPVSPPTSSRPQTAAVAQPASSPTVTATSTHLLYAPTLLSDAQALVQLRTTAPMRERIEPVLTALSARIGSENVTPQGGTDVEGTPTETSSVSRPTHSPVSRLTSPAVASVKSFGLTGDGSGAAVASDRGVLLALLEAVLKEWQASEVRQATAAGRT